MNLTAQLAELYRRLSYTSAPPSAVTTRLTSYLNITHRQLLGMPGMETLRDDTITFASVSGQVYYGLPPSVARVEAITDRSTALRLRLLSRDDIRDGDPGLLSTGSTDSYSIFGFQQVQVQPTAATGLWAVSSAAGDTTQSVFVETVRTGGYRYTASLTLNGVTRVQLAALTDHVEVVKFYLSAVGVGNISLYTASSGGTELARITIGQTYARYLGIQLWPTPTSAITYYVDYVRTIPDMSNGTDEPLLPEDFHWLLVEGALDKEWTGLDDSRQTVARAAYAKGLSALKYFVTCPADFAPSRNGSFTERSRFGANYPATRF